eukprot:COSAG02_NODE_46221_length_350_cov_2.003984_1_plen_40_part_01
MTGPATTCVSSWMYCKVADRLLEHAVLSKQTVNVAKCMHV